MALDADRAMAYDSSMNTTIAAYIPVVPQPGAQASAPIRVANFDPGVIGMILVMLLGLVVLSRGGR